MERSDLTLSTRNPFTLAPHHNLFQSGAWASFKRRYEEMVQGFTLHVRQKSAALLLIHRRLRDGTPFAYCPYGPNVWVPEGEQGALLEELALRLRPHLRPEPAFLRFDTVWETPYQEEDDFLPSGQWAGPPETRVREIRMNYGTATHRIRKSPSNFLPANTVLVDLSEGMDAVFSRMRQNTRNCIRRFLRSDLAVRRAGPAALPEWYEIYKATARRKGFRAHAPHYFRELLRLPERAREEGGPGTPIPRMELLLATSSEAPVAGLLMARYDAVAYYLFAGSLLRRKDAMPSYGLQWEAMRIARRTGCRWYDLFGIAPNGMPGHALHGLYVFKTGFGGRLVHRRGAWDYVYDDERYRHARHAESLDPHV
jgi:lipid II:glycine glycyltransferase (peptidoglycan interpeptide bridge formation enzyme)